LKTIKPCPASKLRRLVICTERQKHGSGRTYQLRRD
jgi:hypothetical protein